MSSWFGGDSSQSQAYDKWQNTDVTQHEPDTVHELIAGAASFEAAKAYEDHVAKNGQPPSHERAKEIIAGLAGAFVDREVESKGLDFIDKEKAKRQARQQAEQGYDSQYGGQNY